MYEAFYGLSRRPFSKTPDPAFLYEGAQHGEALARLELAVSEREVALLTGDTGAGKTTVCRALLDKLEGRHRTALLSNPRMSAAQMLHTVAERLGVTPVPRVKEKLVDALAEHLYALHEEGVTPIVLVEDAHLVSSKAVFEELRQLASLQLDDAPLLSIVLVGGPGLRDKLARPDQVALLERTGVGYALRPFGAAETAAYVAHRLAVAGRVEPLFSDEAIASIHDGSGGVPRRINTICHSALLVGLGADKARIERSIVDDVRADLATHVGAVFERPSAVEARR